MEEKGTLVEKVPQLKRRYPKCGVNHKCVCGSGKKFKYCHGKDKRFTQEANALVPAQEV